MPNFVDDNTDLPFPKHYLRSAPEGKANQYIQAKDWNTLCQAVIDLRDALNNFSFAEYAGGVAGLVPASDNLNEDTEYLRKDGTWQPIIIPNYPEFAGDTAGLVPASDGLNESTSYLGKDGTWRTVPSFAGDTAGLVPASDGLNEDTSYLKKDGTWGVPTGAADTRDIFNVLDYGADFTGLTDCKTAIRNTIAAAAANVTTTGRRSAIYFPPGVYLLTNRDAIQTLDINGLSKLTFVGASGGRSRLYQQGNAATANWHMFVVRGGSTDITFKDLVLDQNVTNPSEQTHLVQLGNGNGTNNGCSDIIFDNVHFMNCFGDGIRLLGDFASKVERVWVINGTKFTDCKRSSISFQRWVRGVSILGCKFIGGSDQQIDSEPTGYALTASASSTATTLIDTKTPAKFITWGIQAGDPIYNVDDDILCTVASVDSETQLTINTGATTWGHTTQVDPTAGAQYYFPLHNSGHQIKNCVLEPGNTARSLLWTFSGMYAVSAVGNIVHGCIQAQDVMTSDISHNIFLTRPDGSNQPAVTFIKACNGTRFEHNTIITRQTDYATTRNGLSCYTQVGRRPTDISISHNRIRMETRGLGIYVEGARSPRIDDNDITLYTPGDSAQSAGIVVTATNGDMDRVRVVGNRVKALTGSGSWIRCIDVSTSGKNIGALEIGGGHVDTATSASIRFSEASGGVYLSPPVLHPMTCDMANVVPPPSQKFFQLAGMGGIGAQTGSRKPGMYWGDGSPEGVLTAGVGSLAIRRDGTGGATQYVKVTGTSNTGWAPIGGVVATGTIVCVAKASLTDGDFITVSDGVSAPKVYEFDVAGDGVTAGRIQVNVSTDTTATQVGDRLKTAIETNQPLFTIVNTTGSLALTHKVAGTFANITITENVANAGFTVTGMSGGVNPAR